MIALRNSKCVCFALFASILIFSAIATAGPSAHRLKEGSGLLNDLLGTNTNQKQSIPDTPITPRTGSKQGKFGLYDGVWHTSDGRTLLIKQIHRTLYVSGSSLHAAWQAQCVMATELARCIGTGISNTAGEFHYESKFRLSDVSLKSDWMRNYNNGNAQSGHRDWRVLR